MMKAIIISKVGGPEVLELKDIKLEDPKSNEVLIKNEAIGLNYIDTYHRSGLYPVELPSRVGLEGAGIIEKIGPNVKNFKVGDKVAYASMPIGSYSTHRIFPTKKLVKVPEGIELENVVTLMTKGITTFYLLHKTYPVKSGETILFHAAAGGVGQILCQWAKSLGCTVIGTVGSDEKIEIAKVNGCDHVINYSKENFAEKVKEITNGDGVPVVYDGVGKDTFKISLDCLDYRGLFVSFGQSSGMVPEVNLHKTFNPKSLFYTRPTLMHYNLTREQLEKSSNLLFQKIINKEIIEHIYKVIELKNASEAHKLIESRESYGSIILKP